MKRAFPRASKPFRAFPFGVRKFFESRGDKKKKKKLAGALFFLSKSVSKK